MLQGYALQHFLRIRRIQHIFDEDTVATGRVIDQHVGDCTYQFAILDDG